MILGDENVGKTALLRALNGEEVTNEDDVMSTCGLEVATSHVLDLKSPWVIPLNKFEHLGGAVLVASDVNAKVGENNTRSEDPINAEVEQPEEERSKAENKQAEEQRSEGPSEVGAQASKDRQQMKNIDIQGLLNLEATKKKIGTFSTWDFAGQEE